MLPQDAARRAASGRARLPVSRMPWFKVHIEIIDDPKMASLSDSQFRLWIGLLAMARESTEPGVILLSDELIAWRLRRDVPTIMSAITSFSDLNMAKRTPKGLLLPNFRARQWGAPSNEPPAIAQRKRVSRVRHEDVTTHVTTHVTSLSRGMSREKIGGEVDVEEEVEEETTGTNCPREAVVASSGRGQAPPDPTTPSVALLVPDEPEWAPALREVRAELDDIQAPKDFYVPGYWVRVIQAYGGDDCRVVVFRELRKYLAWIEAKKRRQRNLLAGFRNWLSKAEYLEENNAQRQEFSARRRR